MLTYLTAGESHGPQLTSIIDGLPSGLKIDIDRLNLQLARRQRGYGRGGRMKIESDEARIVSGVRHGLTMGGPITLVIPNRDWTNWQKIMDPLKPIGKDLTPREQRLAFATTRPRPGHADLAGGVKWHHHDLRNVLERASARETAARVALGALARQFLEHFKVRLISFVAQIGDIRLGSDVDISDLERLGELIEDSDVRCPDPAVSVQMIDEIKSAQKAKDSLGGVVQLLVRGLPVGLGSCAQWHRRLDSQLAGAIMSIPSVKGVEIGKGFELAGCRGSEVHDRIFYTSDGDPARKCFYRKTNNAGGLEGGITNGEDIVVRAAAKPISTLNQPLETVDVKTKESAEAMVERTDHCVIPALGVICEAVAALVLVDAFLNKFGSDNMVEIEQNYRAYLKTPY